MVGTAWWATTGLCHALLVTSCHSDSMMSPNGQIWSYPMLRWFSGKTFISSIAMGTINSSFQVRGASCEPKKGISLNKSEVFYIFCIKTQQVVKVIWHNAALLQHMDGSRICQMAPYQVASWSIEPFGHNRYGPKIGAPFGEGELSPHVTQCGQDRGIPACQVSSLIRLTVWPQYTVTDRTGQTDNGPIA